MMANLMSRLRQIIITAFLSISILSCGGESAIISAGISGTGIVLGVITGFGSIYVNGVKYDIDQANIDVDGSNGNLAIGMVVRLDATDNGDGTGLADSVVYDDAIEGPISSVSLPSTVNANQRQFTILGQSILIDSTSTTFYGSGATFNFNTIAKNDVVEVSGFVDPVNNMIIATRVEKKGVYPAIDTVEMHGQVENLDLGIGKSFVLNGVSVDISLIDDSKLSDLPEGLKDGQHVEVNGTYQSDTAILAAQIEGEDDDFEKLTNASGDLSLQGVVTDYVSPADFELNGIRVDASSIDSSKTIQLKNGIQIQVKGEYSAGVLIAQQLDIRTGESQFDAVISSVDDVANNRIEIEYPGLAQTVTLVFDQQSQLVDDTFHHSRALTLDQLALGWQVKAQVKKLGNDWVVVSLKHDNLDEYKIRGYITEIDISSYTVVINGLTVALSDSASYEIDDDDNYSRADFFGYIDVTDPMKSFVDLEDEAISDGEANFLEVELDTNH